MVRWGFHLFQSDADLDTCDDVEDMIVAFLKSEDMGPLLLNTPELQEVGDKIVKDADDQDYENGGGFYLRDRINSGDPIVRKLLDNAIGYTLFDLAKGDAPTEIIIGAMMMQAGAKLRSEDKRRLRTIIARYPEGQMELPENGFWNAGQAQLSAALDHYVAGTPRDLHAPSCDNCGQIEADIGTMLLECERCMLSWWCNEECKTANIEKHAGHGLCVDNRPRRVQE